VVNLTSSEGCVEMSAVVELSCKYFFLRFAQMRIMRMSMTEEMALEMLVLRTK